MVDLNIRYIINTCFIFMTFKRIVILFVIKQNISDTLKEN